MRCVGWVWLSHPELPRATQENSTRTHTRTACSPSKRANKSHCERFALTHALQYQREGGAGARPAVLCATATGVGVPTGVDKRAQARVVLLARQNRAEQTNPASVGDHPSRLDQRVDRAGCAGARRSGILATPAGVRLAVLSPRFAPKRVL